MIIYAADFLREPFLSIEKLEKCVSGVSSCCGGVSSAAGLLASGILCTNTFWGELGAPITSAAVSDAVRILCFSHNVK